MADASDVRHVLARFGVALATTDTLDSLGNAGGFSGARFWRLSGGKQPLCLRRWPAEHPSPVHLLFIHEVLRFAGEAGFQQIPRPIPNPNGDTVVEHASHLWELTPWMAGQADYAERPNRDRIRSATSTLARFHQVLRSFPGNHWGDSYSVNQRRKLLERYNEEEVALIERRVERDSNEPWTAAARDIVRAFRGCRSDVANQFSTLQPFSHLQPCIRDIWHDNVLFTGDEVSSLIDFGAMRFDHPATDLARLLGSMAGDEPTKWADGLHAYSAKMSLDEDFVFRVAAMDRTAVLLSGMNWLRWLYVERREFDDRTRVTARITETCRRLQHLNQHLDRPHPALEVF